MAGIELYAPRLAKHRRTWTWAAIVLVLVFFIVGQFGTILLSLPFGGIPFLMAEGSWQAMAVQLFGFAFCALLVFLWVWLFERRGLDTIGFNAQGALRYTRGFLIGLGFLAAVVGLITLFGGYRVESAGFWQAPSLAIFIPVVVLLAGFVVQGGTEEVFMRGWLMQLLASRHGVWWAIGVNMIYFSLLHGMNIKPSPELALGLINIVLVAILLSLYALKEGSLWGVCAWHSAWNWLLGVGFGLEVSGIKPATQAIVIDMTGSNGAPWWLTGGSFGPEGSVVTTVVLAAGVIWLFLQGAQKPKGYSAAAEDDTF